MLRIYFDTQIISNLQHSPPGKDEVYLKLLKLLKNQNDSYLLIYSVGHLSDLKRDLSDHKNKDLKFMEEIGFTHFMNLSGNSSWAYILEVLPYEKYYSGIIINKTPNFENIKESNHYLSFILRVKNIYQQHLNLLKKFETGGIGALTVNDAEIFLKMYNQIQLSSEEITFEKYLEMYYELMRELDEQTPDNLRSFINFKIPNTHSTMPMKELNKIDFSKSNLKYSLRNTKVQEFIIDIMIRNMLDKGYNYEMLNNEHSVTDIYNSFHLTGFIPEKKPGKIKIKNMVSDSSHTLFASYCDLFVTEDNKMAQKAKVIYGALYINTLVLKPEEFLDYIEIYSKSIVLDKWKILSYVQEEVQNHLSGERSKHELLLDYYSFDSEWRYLNFFNSIEYYSKGSYYYVNLVRINNNYKSSWTLKEITRIIDIAYTVFGRDTNNNSHFDLDTEGPQIKSNTWIGRRWLLDSLLINLIVEPNNFYHVVLSISYFKHS